jgi:hypothetical protein
MTDVPRRFKNRDEYDMAEEVAAVQATRAGRPVPKFETKAYRTYRSDLLREGGLDDEAAETETADPPPLADQSVQEHFDRITGPR